MKLAILLFLVGLENPFFGTIEKVGPVCPESTVTLQIPARTGQTYQWEWRRDANDDWKSFQSPVSLSGSEMLSTAWPTTMLPAEVRVKSWQADSIWYSAPRQIEGPTALTPRVQGALRVCTGQDARLRVDFPPQGAWQWERLSQGQFIPVTESNKFTRTQQPEMIIRGTAGLDDQSVFRCRWTSPDGCIHYSHSTTLHINQLSTISPTPSTTICQDQPQTLRTAGIQGAWTRNEWLVADSLGILRLQVDSVGRSLHLPAWPTYLRNVQVRGWFQTFQRVGADTVSGTCSLTSSRVYTVTPAPKPLLDSIYSQCGLDSIRLDPQGGDWSFSKLGPWISNAGWLPFSNPDTISIWYRLRNATGCPSAPYTITYKALPMPSGTLYWNKDFLCASDTLLPLEFIPEGESQLWFRWENDTLTSRFPILSQQSRSLSWQWRNVETGCFSRWDSTQIRYIPPLQGRINGPTEPICPGELVSLEGIASDTTARWTWQGFSSLLEGVRVQTRFDQSQSGMASVQNACERLDKPWQVLVKPDVEVRISPPKRREVCAGDSTVWEVQFSESVDVTWHSALGGVQATGNRWVAQAETVGRTLIWYKWIDSCGRQGQSDTLEWIIHPTPARPSLEDTLYFCLGQKLPISNADERWVWSDGDPVSVGDFPYTVRASNEFGCSSRESSVLVRVSPTFELSLIQTQSWMCTTGLRNRRVFIQNSTAHPIQWITPGVLEHENGWVVEQPGGYVASQRIDWCTQYDTVFVQPQHVRPWIEVPATTFSYCPSEDPILSLPLESSSAIFWYETAFQEVPVHSGNEFTRFSRQPIWVRKREFITNDLFCESEAIRIEPVPMVAILPKVSQQDRCRGNLATFEVEIQGEVSPGQWWQKKPNDPDFLPIIGANQTQLRIQNSGSSAHPDQSLYRFTLEKEDCQVVSDEMKLSVLGFIDRLSSTETCAGSVFPLSIPTHQGTLMNPEWQTRPGTSGSWAPQNPPEVIDVGSQFWRVRGQFLMENGSTCSQTSDDARVQVHTAKGDLTIWPDSCPGQPSHFNWVPTSSGGTFSWNSLVNTSFSGRLPAGNHVFQSTFKGCQWDTLVGVSIQEHILSKPVLPSFTRYFLGDTLDWNKTAARKELRWFLDSMATQPIPIPLLAVPGKFSWFASYSQQGCPGPTAIWEGEIKQPLLVRTPKTYVHQCAGLSMDLAVDAIGEGEISFQWFQSRDSTSGWTALTPWTSRHRGELSPVLRVYSVGSFPHVEGSWYRCLVRDEFGERWSDPIQLEVWVVRGNLLPHQFVCEDSNPILDIRAFRGWLNNEKAGYWEIRSAQGWVAWRTGYQLPLQEQPEGEFRFAWEFENSNQATCRLVSDSFRLQKVKKPEPPTENEWSFCQEDRVVAAPLSGSQFNWYFSPDQGIVTSTTTPRISLRESGILEWWLARRGPHCESDRIPVRIQIHPQPSAPVSTTAREVTGYEVIFSAEGEQLKWYRTVRAPSQHEPPRFVHQGNHRFFVTQTNTWGCESPQRLIESRLTWPARITQQPQNLFECGGNVVTFQLRMQGAENFQYQWFRKQPSADVFHPISGATWPDLRISGAGMGEFTDSSRYFCQIQWGTDRILVSDTVSLWINSVAAKPANQQICHDAKYALDSSMAGVTGNVRQFFWEVKQGTQWISKPGMTWPLDSFPSGTTTVRARVIFQSEIRETCARTSGEFKVSVLPQKKDLTLPTKVFSCDTAFLFPAQLGWAWEKQDTLFRIRAKQETGCWSEWSDVSWEREICWTDVLDCAIGESLPDSLEARWKFFRLPNGLAWAKARGEGLISHSGQISGRTHWVFQGKGALEAPPSIPKGARWLVSPPVAGCSGGDVLWEAHASVDVQRYWETDSSVSITWQELPPAPSFSGEPHVEGAHFSWEGGPLSEWQRWDAVQSRWQTIVFPLDTAYLTDTFRYRHWFTPTIFEWITVPALTWAKIPVTCHFKGIHQFSHTLQFPIQADIRTIGGQLIQSFTWQKSSDAWPQENRSNAGPMKILTFTDRWGRSCTVRQWSD